MPRLILLALALAAWVPSSATAQDGGRSTIVLPLAIYDGPKTGQPLASEQYLDAIVSVANRWFRPAGVCFAVSSRHVFGEATEFSEIRPLVDDAHAVAVAIVEGLRRNGTEPRGVARYGSNTAVIAIDRTVGVMGTLTHELGHILDLEHSDDDDAAMHTPSDRLARFDVMSRTEQRVARAAALSLVRRFDAPATLRCPQARPVDLNHPEGLEVHAEIPWSGGVYVGETVFGAPHGEGRLRHQGYVYSGSWFMGQRHGLGDFRWANGQRYVGHFRRGERHGQGEYRWVTGERYVGRYRHDHQDGRGTVYFPSGNVRDGEWRQGRRLRWSLRRR